MKYYNRIVGTLKSENKDLLKSQSNIDIDGLGDRFLGKSYGGCYAADTFVDHISNHQKGDGTVYIVNTQNESQGGAHWICFIDDKDGLLGYDSYAKKLTKYNKLFKNLNFTESTNDREQRYNNEYTCGLRSLAAGITYKYMSKHNTPENNFGRECFLLI